MKKLILAFIILISCVVSCYGQDQIINGRSSYVQISPPATAWSTLSSQTYVFTPINPDYGICLSLVNNNPTNAHTITLTAFQSSDSNVPDFTHFQGRYNSITIVGTPSPVAALTTTQVYLPANAAAKLALVFSGGGTLAGSPDTVDIFAVQTTQKVCGGVNPATGQGYTLSTPNTGTSSAPPIMSVADGTNSAFSVTTATVNPTASQFIGVVNNTSNTNGKSLYFDKVVVSSTVNTTLTLTGITNAGTCSINSPATIKIGAANTPVSTAGSNCTVVPTTSGQSITFFILANSPFTIDLKGYIALNGTNGLGMQSIAVTGTVSLGWYWYEK